MDKIKITKCNVAEDNKVLFIFSGLEQSNECNYLLAEQLMNKLTNNYKRYFNLIPSFEFRNERIVMYNVGIHDNYDTETYLWILHEDVEKYLPIIKNFMININKVKNYTRINTIKLIKDAFGSKIIRGE